MPQEASEEKGRCEALYVGLIEYAACIHPPGMEGWRCYRIEYGGFNECCVAEGHLWLPPNVDSLDVERLFEGWQSGKVMLLSPKSKGGTIQVSLGETGTKDDRCPPSR